MDRVLEYVRDAAQAQPAVRRVLLFGSRARGDQRERSDYDLAVSAPGMSRADWVRWKLELEERAPTLCGLDLVLLEQLEDASLSRAIERDGVVIHEKSPGDGVELREPREGGPEPGALSGLSGHGAA
jgi:predicted nucleotidyltransferase